jgi:acetyl esterase/lipase
MTSITSEGGAMEMDQVRLYDGAAPGSESWTHEEQTIVDPATGSRGLRNVVVPTITPVLPSPEAAVGSAVVIAPGGGFAGLSWDHEGLSTAAWFTERGVAAFVLKYRLAPLPTDPAEVAAKLGAMPAPGSPEFGPWFARVVGDTPDLASADGEQAIRLIRGGAASWGVDPDRIGIIGFSAGATVALRAGASTDRSARADFVADIYGAFLGREVPADSPPLFAVVAADDGLCRGMVFDAVQQWVAAGAPAELHVYERGGHGFGLAKQGAPTDSWPARLEEWLELHRVLSRTPDRADA